MSKPTVTVKVAYDPVYDGYVVTTSTDGHDITAQAVFRSPQYQNAADIAAAFVAQGYTRLQTNFTKDRHAFVWDRNGVRAFSLEKPKDYPQMSYPELQQVEVRPATDPTDYYPIGSRIKSFIADGCIELTETNPDHFTVSDYGKETAPGDERWVLRWYEKRLHDVSGYVQSYPTVFYNVCDAFLRGRTLDELAKAFTSVPMDGIRACLRRLATDYNAVLAELAKRAEAERDALWERAGRRDRSQPGEQAKRRAK